MVYGCDIGFGYVVVFLIACYIAVWVVVVALRFCLALVVVCALWLLVMFGLSIDAAGSVFNVCWCLGWCFWWFLFACRFIGLVYGL